MSKGKTAQPDPLSPASLLAPPPGSEAFYRYSFLPVNFAQTAQQHYRIIHGTTDQGQAIVIKRVTACFAGVNDTVANEILANYTASIILHIADDLRFVAGQLLANPPAIGRWARLIGPPINIFSASNPVGIYNTAILPPSEWIGPVVIPPQKDWAFCFSMSNPVPYNMGRVILTVEGWSMRDQEMTWRSVTWPQP